jgi:hypothetical protein
MSRKAGILKTSLKNISGKICGFQSHGFSMPELNKLILDGIGVWLFHLKGYLEKLR